MLYIFLYNAQFFIPLSLNYFHKGALITKIAFPRKEAESGKEGAIQISGRKGPVA